MNACAFTVIAMKRMQSSERCATAGGVVWEHGENVDGGFANEFRHVRRGLECLRRFGAEQH